MKIAVKNGKDGGWKRIPNGGQHGGTNLKDLIYQIPELISNDDLVAGALDMKVCIKNMSTNGPGDAGGIVGVDGSGRISIVECKIPNDSSARREIMGQALEYAANLWEMSYEEFDGLVSSSEGKSLTELMKEKVTADGWSEEEFKNSVTSALRQGKFLHLPLLYMYLSLF